MSIKVYDAYRLKEGVDIWAASRSVFKDGRESAIKRLKYIYEEFATKVDVTLETYQALIARGCSERKARLRIVQDMLRTKFREAARGSNRDYFDFSVSMTFREHEGRIYVRTYADMLMRNVFDFLQKDSNFESYEYWNNSDPPEEFVKGEAYLKWKEREKIWDAIYDRDQHFYLTLEICSYEGWIWIDPGDELIRAAG